MSHGLNKIGPTMMLGGWVIARWTPLASSLTVFISALFCFGTKHTSTQIFCASLLRFNKQYIVEKLLADQQQQATELSGQSNIVYNVNIHSSMYDKNVYVLQFSVDMFPSSTRHDWKCVHDLARCCSRCAKRFFMSSFSSLIWWRLWVRLVFSNFKLSTSFSSDCSLSIPL